MKRTLFLTHAFLNKVFLFLSLLLLFNINSFGQVVNWKSNGNTSISGDYIGSNNNEDFIIKTNGTTAVKVKANGNFILKSLESLGAGLVTFDNNGKILPLVFSGDNTQVLLGDGTFSSVPNGFWSNGSGGKIYYNGGKVGIGTASPNFKLDVDGDVRITQNLYLQGGLVISEKIETPKQMKAKAIITDSIMTDSTKGFYGTTTFNGVVKLQSKLNVFGTSVLNGNTQVNGTLSSLGDINFGGNKSIGYTPGAAGFPATIHWGTLAAFPPPSDALAFCSFPTPNLILKNEFLGILQSYGNNSEGTSNVMSVGFDGANGIIDIAGNTSTGTSPTLLINYYCGKNVNVCTGVNNGNVNMCNSDGHGNVSMCNGPVGGTVLMCNTGNGISGNVNIGNTTAATDSKVNITNVSNIYPIGLKVHNQSIAGISNSGIGILSEVEDDTKKAFVVAKNGSTYSENFVVYGDGHVLARDIKVTLGTLTHPDFVFEKNYKMMSLEELEVYLQKNKHLPEVPSAKEVELGNGIDLGKMSELGLQKTEELYLYVIELNKKLNELSEIVQTQKEEIKSLKEK